jgi:hypothetical protein
MSPSRVDISLRDLDGAFAAAWTGSLAAADVVCSVGTAPQLDIVLPNAAYRSLPRNALRVMARRDGQLHLSHLGLKGSCLVNGAAADELDLAPGRALVELSGHRFELNIVLT